MLSNFQEISTKPEWENLVKNFPEANFLQSYNWGEFQAKLHKKVFRFALLENNQPQIIFQAIKETAKRGNYLTIAGGPLLNWSTLDSQLFTTLIKFLKNLARTEHCLFIRFRPQVIDSPNLREKLRTYGIISSPMHLTADLTLQLDLTKDYETLLSEMRKNTRYEIKQIAKKNITVEQSQEPAKIKAFYEQQLAVAQKHHFVPFAYDFLLEQFKIFAANDQAVLFSSYQAGKLLASAFVIFYHGEAVYHYGISTEANYKLPGAYACQIAAIKAAQQRGCKTYNFWGIAPKDEPHHRFAGVSLFKRGFGGQEINYLPAHDLPTSILYWPTYLFETLRKKSRKL